MFHFQVQKMTCMQLDLWYRSYENCRHHGFAILDMQINKLHLISGYAHGEVNSIQHYVIKFISDLQQAGDFPLVLRFPPQIKLNAII